MATMTSPNPNSLLSHELANMQSPVPPRRVLIVDAQELTRLGLVELVRREPDLDLGGAAATVDEALESAARLLPHLVIAVLRPDRLDLVHLVRGVAALETGGRVLVVSAQMDRQSIERILRCGAHGLIDMNAPIQTLLTAVRRVLDGEYYLSTEVTQTIIASSLGNEAAEDTVESLSERETMVLELIGRGRSVKEIALQLSVSGKTVEYYRQRIKEKMRFPSTQALVRYATMRALQHSC